MRKIEEIQNCLKGFEVRRSSINKDIISLKSELRKLKGTAGDLRVLDKFFLYGEEYEMLGTGSISDINQNHKSILDVHQEIRNIVIDNDCTWAFRREEDGRPRVVLIRNDTVVQ